MLIQAVDGRINTHSCSLYVRILQTFRKTVFEIAQLDDEALSDGAQTSLLEGGASRGDGGGVHGESLCWRELPL